MRSALFALLAYVLAALAFPASASAAAKVEICHLPPGGPTNAQSITVSETAVPAHLAHGDTLGACASGCTGANQCDDGNLCTFDQCLPNGQCSNEAVDCSDGNICTLDICLPTSGCENPPADGLACDDGNICTASDVCDNGVCAGAPIQSCCTADAECTDNDACSVDLCVNNACSNDLIICPDADICNVGVCVPGVGVCDIVPVSCDDGNICTDDSCDPDGAGCVSVPTQNPPEPEIEITCNDGLDNDCDGLVDEADSDCVGFCGEVCDEPHPTCGGGSVCNPAVGICEPNPFLAPPGTYCAEDGDLCTYRVCDGTGGCVVVGSVNCGAPPHEICGGGSVCNPAIGSCEPNPFTASAGTSCNDDGDLCTLEACDGNGSCVFVGSIECAAPNVCNPATGQCVAP